MYTAGALAKNKYDSQAKPASAGQTNQQTNQDSPAPGAGNFSSDGGAAAAAASAAGATDLTGGSAVGSSPFSGGGAGTDELFGDGLVAEFPIAEKGITKYVEADFMPTDDYLSGENFPPGTSLVGDSTNKAVQEARITSDRVEPIAVFSQRGLDFFGNGMSPAYASVYQAFIEDRFSQAFSLKLFSAISEAQPDFFADLDASIDTSIEKAQSIIDVMKSIFTSIRKFESSFSNNRENIRSISLQLASEIAETEPLIASSPIFDSVMDLFVREYSNSMGKSSAFAVFGKLTQTAQMAVNLAIAQSYFQRGCSYSILGINYPYQGGVDPFGVFFPSSKKQAMFPTQAPDYPAPDKKELSIKMLAAGTPLDGTDLEQGNYRYTRDPFDFFYRDQVRKNRSPLDAAAILSTIVANEFCVSAGLARLSDTPLGNQFGPDSNFAKSLFGLSGAGDITKLATNPGSLADHLIVKEDGSTSTSFSTDEKVLLFDGSKHESQTRKGVTTCTSAFAKNVLKNLSENKMEGYKTAIQGNLNRSQEAMDFYVKLHNRDKNLTLLTPRGLFTRILEEVHASLQEGAVGFNLMNRLKVGELSFYNIFGSIQPYSIKTHIERLRAIYYTAMCRQAFKGIQPEEAFQSIDITQSDAALDHSKIRFARKDMVRTGIPYKKPAVSMMTARLLMGLSPEEATEQGFAQFTFNMEEQYDYIYSSESLTARLARVFKELHDEADEIAASDGGEAGIVDSDRYTRASKLDAANLSAMIFEIAAMCVSTFFESKIVLENIEHFDLAADLFLTIVNSSNPSQTMTDIEKTDGFFGLTKGKGFFAIDSGPDSRNDFCARALNELINGSKSDDFSSLYNDDNTIPNLGNILPSENIASDSSGAVTSFLQVQQKFEMLAVERDVPYASLLAHQALVEYTAQNTENLVSISDQLSGIEEKSETVQRYFDFVSTNTGRKYAASATDVIVQTSQKRLGTISKQRESDIKRLPRLSLGELSCMKIVLGEIANIGSDTIMLVNIGLPNEMLENIIYPRFKAEAGFEIPVSEATLRVELNSFDALKSSSNSSVSVSRHFLPKESLTSESFSYFENSQMPLTVQEIVNNMILIGGTRGQTFISESANPNLARTILENELFSYMTKKFVSIISPADLFVETGKLHTEKGFVDTGALSLAKTFANAAGLSESAFSGVFLPDSNGRTKFSKKVLLSKTVSPGLDSFGNIIPREMDFATADMFADIFGSIAFTSSAIESSVFTETHYEKICCLVVSPNEFLDLDEESSDTIIYGEEASSDNSYAAFLMTDLVPGSIRMNTYEATVSVGDRLVPK